MARLVWFRSDLRTIDCEPLLQACRENGEVHACFLVCAEQWQRHGVGPNRIEYIRLNLADLSRRLAALGIPLHIRNPGLFKDVPRALKRLVQDLNVTKVTWGIEYEVNERLRDARCREALGEIGVECAEFHDQVIIDPDGPRSGKGDPYRVFTPYASAWHKMVAMQSKAPACVRPEPRGRMPVAPDPIPEDFNGSDGAVDLSQWPVGEEAALERVQSFIATHVSRYASDRDHPGRDGRVMPSTNPPRPWTSRRVDASSKN